MPPSGPAAGLSSTDAILLPSFVCIAQREDITMVVSIGRASANKGMFDNVQYRRNPTFLERKSDGTVTTVMTVKNCCTYQ